MGSQNMDAHNIDSKGENNVQRKRDKLDNEQTTYTRIIN